MGLWARRGSSECREQDGRWHSRTIDALLWQPLEAAASPEGPLDVIVAQIAIETSDIHRKRLECIGAPEMRFDLFFRLGGAGGP